ncbi:MAG: NnrU family protein [Acetobacteraceae bacterium]|nr:NnrU family protein [Acetobacteraceae bacterium]
MLLLLLAAVLWVAWHVGLSGTRLRDAVVARLGENAFRITFSLGSVATIVFLVFAYRGASGTQLWTLPAWLQWLLVAAMIPASMLFVGSVATRNPTAVGANAGSLEPARGVIRITRHPMLWAFGIWAGVHLIANGDTASLLFFGAFLVTIVAGIPSLDAKLARRNPARWQPLAAATSMIPGAAIAQGRNRVVVSELWLPIVGGAALWLILLFGHPHVIGVAPWPT